MRTLSAIEAGKVLGVTHTTIHRYVRQGLLSARYVGIRRILRFDIEDLRRFAAEYQIDFNEDVLKELME